MLPTLATQLGYRDSYRIAVAYLEGGRLMAAEKLDYLPPPSWKKQFVDEENP
jgi:hypothetical protein